MDFERATKAQLIDYAREELGLNLPNTMRRDELLARIDQKLRERDGKPRNKVKIKIMKDPSVTGNDDVMLSINGRAITIKRDYEVWVHPMYVALLQNCRRVVRTQDPETLKWHVDTAPMYPFMILDGHDVFERFMKGDDVSGTGSKAA